MATISLYNEAGTGFAMPVSAANGYVIASGTETAGTAGSVLYDDGSLLILEWLFNPGLDQIVITYSIIGDQVTIFDIEYDNNGFVVLELLDVNLVGSISDLQSGDLFYVELTRFNDTIEGNDFVDIIFGGPGTMMYLDGARMTYCLAMQVQIFCMACLEMISYLVVSAKIYWKAALVKTSYLVDPSMILFYSLLDTERTR